jgi:xanthine dehydrogenase accessory factor
VSERSSEEGLGVRRRMLIKGAGDLASGIALRLHHAGFDVALTEIARPTTVRRTVAFSEAVYEGDARVEDVLGHRIDDPHAALAAWQDGVVPVLVGDQGAALRELQPDVLVDAIVAKRNLGTRITDAPAVIALGPGFVAGRDAHAVVETRRGHTLGRVIWRGEAAPNTGVPGEIGGYSTERLLRAPVPGVFRGALGIGDTVAAGQVVGFVGDDAVRANVSGVLRGLLHDGVEVTAGFKLGDVDPRAERAHCFTVSDKALAVAGGVLEAACALLGGARRVTQRGT